MGISAEFAVYSPFYIPSLLGLVNLFMMKKFKNESLKNDKTPVAYSFDTSFGLRKHDKLCPSFSHGVYNLYRTIRVVPTFIA
jgi:hypothetical protein